jgi:hypothetical protein
VGGSCARHPSGARLTGLRVRAGSGNGGCWHRAYYKAARAGQAGKGRFDVIRTVPRDKLREVG